MKVRKARIEDANVIGFVLSQSYNIESIQQGKNAFYNELKKGINYIVAEEDGKIIGLTTWFNHGLPKHGLIELDRIAVLPEFRGKGVAKQLFLELINHADNELKKFGQKLRKLFLLTHADNKQAQAFYTKMGLSHETTLKSHFYEEKDELVMSKFF